LVSEEDYTITAPTFEKKIGEFEIVDTSSSLPELTPEGKLRQTQSYILEPFLSGEYTIPSMRFAFQNTQTKENHEIETEPLVILVSSISTDVQNLTLHDIELPVDLPKPKKNFTFPQILIGLLIVAVIVALVFYKKMPRKERLKKQIPAHERALEALKE